MTRFHATEKGNIPFTNKEEQEWDAKEQIFNQERPKILIKANIAALEASVTPRRQREAILGADNGWLANVDLEIAELRGQL